MNHANKRIGVCLKEAASKLEVELYNSKAKVYNTLCELAKADADKAKSLQSSVLSRFIDCLKLHVRHGHGRVKFDFHLPSFIRQFCEMEGMSIVYGLECCVVKW